MNRIKRQRKRTPGGVWRRPTRILVLTALLLLSHTLAGITAGVSGTMNRAPDWTADAGWGETVFADSGSGTAPAAQITAVKVTADHTLEVGIDLSCESFRGVGAVLQYNSARLRLISWGPEKTPIPLKQETGYGNSVAVYTKGADGLMGKPALAWTGTPETAGAGGDGTGGEGAGGVTDPAVAWNGVYLGADSLKESTLAGESGGKRVVTIRFDYVTAGGTTEERKAAEALLTDAALGACLRFASGSEAADTPVGASFSLITQKGQAEPVCYEMGGAGSGGVQAIAVPIVLKEGGSVDTGGGVMTGGGPVVTFFDWDGSVIDAMALPETVSDREAAVAAFQEKPAVAERLSGKSGYAFDRWLIVKQQGEELATVNGTFPSNKAALDLTDPAVAADAADFSDPALPVSLLVQTAYKAVESEINGGTGTDTPLISDETRYVLGQPTFYQYGSAMASTGQYAVRCKVTRGDVLRARTPTVLAQAFVGGGSAMKNVTMKVDLRNTDDTSFEVVVPKGTETVTLKLLDTYGVTAWTMGTGRSEEIQASGAEIVRQGAFALLVDAALTAGNGGSWSPYVDVQNFKDAGYTGMTEAKLAAARDALAAASAGRSEPLSRAEADAVLAAYK